MIRPGNTSYKLVRRPAVAPAGSAFSSGLIGTGPGSTPALAVPNWANSVLDQQRATAARAQRNGQANTRTVQIGDQTITLPGASSNSEAPPWLTMPATGRPFRYTGAINTPDPDTTEALVLTVTVPDGWTAAIKAYANVFTGDGFQPEDGQLNWAIRIDGACAPGFDAIGSQLGTIEYPREIPGNAALIASSGQRIEYLVSVAAGAVIPTGAASRIVCVLEGWFFPATQ